MSLVYLSLPLTEREHRTIELRERLCLQELAEGTASAKTLAELQFSVSLSAHLAGAGIGPEVAGLAAVADEALRHVVDGGAIEDDVDAVRDLLDHLDSQRRAASRGQLLRAIGLQATP